MRTPQIITVLYLSILTVTFSGDLIHAAKWDLSMYGFMDIGTLAASDSARRFYSETGRDTGWGSLVEDDDHNLFQNNLGFKAMLTIGKVGVGYYAALPAFLEAGSGFDLTTTYAPYSYSYCYSGYYYTECGSGSYSGGTEESEYRLKLPAKKQAALFHYKFVEDSTVRGYLEFGYGRVRLDDSSAEFVSTPPPGADFLYNLSSDPAPLYIFGIGGEFPLDREDRFFVGYMDLSYHIAEIKTIYATRYGTSNKFRLRTKDGTPVSANYGGAILAAGIGIRFGNSGE